MESSENELSVGRGTPSSTQGNNHSVSSQSTLTPVHKPHPKNISELEESARTHLYDTLRNIYRSNYRPNNKTVGQFIFGRFKNSHFKEKINTAIERLVELFRTSGWTVNISESSTIDNIYIDLLSSEFNQFIISFHFTGINGFKELHERPVSPPPYPGSVKRESAKERKYREYIERPAIIWDKGPSGAFHIKYIDSAKKKHYIRLVPKESDVLDFYFAKTGNSTYKKFIDIISGTEDYYSIVFDINNLLEKINAAQIPTLFVDDLEETHILRPLAQMSRSLVSLPEESSAAGGGGAPAAGMGGSSSAFSHSSGGLRKRKTRKSSSRARARARKSRARA
jgi:hypothetical protein